MAFSTQKDFFYVPFFEDKVDFVCIDKCLKLKTYPSTTDDRSWAANESVKSKYLFDLVTCNIPVGADGCSLRDKPGVIISSDEKQKSGKGSGRGCKCKRRKRSE